jgi:hypothetical protein
VTDDNPDRGLSRNRRGVYLRIPVLLYDKLLRLVAAKTAKGRQASVNSVVISLIEDADEPAA